MAYQVYVSEIAYAICSKSKMKTSPYLDLFVDALQNWWKIVLLLVSNTKVRKFLSFLDISLSMKMYQGQTCSERDVRMRFTAKISNVWAQTNQTSADPLDQLRFKI